MARIIYGSIATEINGSIGGQTFQKNAYGFTIKNKPNMVRLQSARQNEIHRNLTKISQLWFTLSQSIRDHWSAFALAHPVQAVHNPSAILTGYTYFLKYNLIRYVAGLSVLNEPLDGSLTLPPIVPVLKKDGQLLAMNPGSDAQYNAWNFNLYLSPPVRDTHAYSVSKTRFMTVAVIGHTDLYITTEYVNRFGIVPSVSDTLFCEVQPFGALIPILVQSQYFVLKVVAA